MEDKRKAFEDAVRCLETADRFFVKAAERLSSLGIRVNNSRPIEVLGIYRNVLLSEGIETLAEICKKKEADETPIYTAKKDREMYKSVTADGIVFMQPKEVGNA